MFPTGSQDAPVQLGPYTIVKPIGRGATAVVYLARRAEREYAVKVRARGDPELDRRFLREFEALRGLSVPGVVRVFDAGIGGELLWYAMEYVRGEPIRTWIEAAGPPELRVQRLLRVGPPLLDALAAVHRAGLVHRDLKPSNVLVDAVGNPWVLDFGVVRWWSDTDALTGDGGLIGTLPFMAPEQVAGAPLTPRADVFAVGLMLLEGVIGRRPRPPRPQDWLRIQCLERPPVLAAVVPDAPLALSALLARMTALDPSDRPDAWHAAAQLRSCAVGEGRPEWPEPSVYVAESRVGIRDIVDAVPTRDGPRLWVLSGPAGSGRRRTAEQVRRRAMLAGVRGLRGACRLERPGGAVQAILDAALEAPAEDGWRRRVAGLDGALLLDLWPHLPVPATAGGVSTDPARDAVRACADALARLGGEAGMLLVFEDLDEVDTFTAKVLEQLVRARPRGVMIVATLDERWASRRARRLVDALTTEGLASTIPARDLDESAAHTVVMNLVLEGVNDTVPPEAGAPLRAVEAGVSQLAAMRGVRWSPVPPSAHPAALVEVPLPAGVWEALGVDVAAAVARGHLRSEAEGWSVADALLRTGALARLPSRAAAARRLADALATVDLRAPNVAAALARARLLADDPEGAYAPAGHAALEAEAAGRYRDARGWLLLIDLLPRDRTSDAYARLRFPLARCRASVADATDAERPRADLVRLAEERATSPAERAEAGMLAAELTRRQGDARQALASYLRIAARAADEGRPEQASVASLRAAVLRLELGQPEEAARQIAQAVALPVPPEARDRVDLRADLARADVALATGDVELAGHHARAAARRAQASGRALALAGAWRRLAQALLYQGDRSGAEEAGDAARRALVLAGERIAAAEAGLHLAVLATARGDAASGALLAGEALATARRLGRPGLRRHALAALLEVAVVRRDSDAAALHLAEAGEAPEDPTAASPLGVATLRWLRTGGESTLALRAARAAPTRGASWADALYAVERARTEVELGEPARAALEVERATGLARAGGFRELVLYAAIVGAACGAVDADAWARTLAAATRSPWVELALVAVLVDARRRAARGDAVGAEARRAEVNARAEEHALLHLVRYGSNYRL